jgi:uncharacterized DUF497 family protein
MQIEFDQARRDKTLQERGLDFARADEVFAGITVTVDDNRHDYGELRHITVVIVWTPRGAARRIISMRYANEREIRRCTPKMG